MNIVAQIFAVVNKEKGTEYPFLFVIYYTPE